MCTGECVYARASRNVVMVVAGCTQADPSATELILFEVMAKYGQIHRQVKLPLFR